MKTTWQNYEFVYHIQRIIMYSIELLDITRYSQYLQWYQSWSNKPVHHFQIQGFETTPAHWVSAEFLHPGMLLGTLLIQELEGKLGPVHIWKIYESIFRNLWPLKWPLIIHWCSSAKFLYGPLVVWKWHWKVTLACPHQYVFFWLQHVPTKTQSRSKKVCDSTPAKTVCKLNFQTHPNQCRINGMSCHRHLQAAGKSSNWWYEPLKKPSCTMMYKKIAIFPILRPYTL